MAEKKKRKKSKRKQSVNDKKQLIVHDQPVVESVKETPIEDQLVVVSLLQTPAEAEADVERKQFWQWLLPLVKATALMTLIVIGTVAGIYFGFEKFYQDRVLPNTFVGSIPLGGFSYGDAKNKLAENFQALQKRSLAFVIDDATYEIPFTEAGVSYDFDRVMSDVRQRKEHDVWGALFLPTHIQSGILVDQSILTQALESAVPTITIPPRDASVYLAQDPAGKPYFAVVPAEAHRTVDFIKIGQTVAGMLEQGHLLPVIVRSYDGIPNISDEEAFDAVKESETWLKNSVKLTYDSHGKRASTFITPNKDWQWLEFDAQDGKLVVRLNNQKWQEVMQKDILPNIEQSKQDVVISLPEGKGKYATVSGTLKDGFQVDQAKSKAAVESVLSTNQVLPNSKNTSADVTLVVNFDQARFISSEGQDLGLKDLLGEGHSRFVGSSSARNFNIRKGLAIYNNLLLSPGEKLSFVSLLGDVTVAAGWKEELVIKEGGNKTVPEAGGGLCQVSTTMYRAVIEAGLEVLERRAHSYLVSYYVGDDDPRAGIDATIYPGSQDLVFVNDTPNYILLQTDTSGVDAYVRIYGTSDGRKVSLAGPVKSGWTTPSSPILTASSALPPGQTKITKAAHNGRTVRWEQTITRPDGKEEKNEIVSIYKAIPAEGLIGAPRNEPTNASAVTL